MQEVEFRLLGDCLTHNGASRHLAEPDWDRFAAWTDTYHDLAWRPDADDALLALGRDIHAWLDGNERWLAALRELADGPVIADFAVPGTPSAQDRQFLEVPWELAATGDTWLAADPAMMWAPLRRIGAVATPPPPNPTHRLGVMFMAAAPRGQTNLDIEAEEVAILRATAELGLDLTVEDSGTLREMSQAWHAAGTLDALHLCCHGMGGDAPFLALEDADGDPAKATLEDLAGGFVQGRPRLVFLSACHTGEGDETVDSLASSLIRVGFPTVLGWADAVSDRDASAFAAAFYARAAQPRTTVQATWAAARYDLLRQQRPPVHWHLARLFLGRTGGGALSAGTAARQRDDPDAGRKGVLDAPGRQIDVASRFEFVGRRRQVQAIQRAFRHKTHAGAVILGLGRQGKSSLAARVIDRHPELMPVVLFRACDGPTLLAELSRKVDGARRFAPATATRSIRIEPASTNRTRCSTRCGRCCKDRAAIGAKAASRSYCCWTISRPCSTRPPARMTFTV
ncbi:MAG TPA: CHAT domain-containing protein [Acetobacteraceae bacterium]|nr:CHAT domain-containing protein [Acetobacteraceae bacterium]